MNATNESRGHAARLLSYYNADRITGSLVDELLSARRVARCLLTDNGITPYQNRRLTLLVARLNRELESR